MTVNEFAATLRLPRRRRHRLRARSDAARPAGASDYFDLLRCQPAGFGGMLPSDLDAPCLPPAAPRTSSPRPDDDALRFSPRNGSSSGFHVDWTDPPCSTFGLRPADSRALERPVRPLQSGVLLRELPPPAGPDRGSMPSADRLMNRLPVPNFGDPHEASSRTTRSTPTARPRRHPLVRARGDPARRCPSHQQGTYAPETRIAGWAARRWTARQPRVGY